MFTNWLTGTTGGGGGGGGNNSATNHNLNENRANTVPPNATANNMHGGNAATPILMSTPPDVILEVGPTPPNTVRFVAHSIVLGMHSGYLRSAIRMDEHALAERTSAAAGSPPDLVLFLGNVTAEQFAPLLTYMYTGYLDLNVENIFGVLLATHVLHMPRALEICRAFLARAQTEGYLGTRLNSLSVSNQTHHNTTATTTTAPNNGKVIRPIPSKATLPNFGFLPTVQPATLTLAQQQQLLPPILATFKGLQQQQQQQQEQRETVYPTQMIMETAERQQHQQEQQRAKSEEIDVDQESTKALSDIAEEERRKDITTKADDDADDEDEEVFIDSSSNTNTDDDDDDDAEVIIECHTSRGLRKKLQQRQQQHQAHEKSKEQAIIVNAEKSKYTKKTENPRKTANAKLNQNRNSGGGVNVGTTRRDKRRQNNTQKQRASSGLQIAKAPIPASQLDANEGSKVIIDVASCDGPVRFRRILNTAYGHKPEDYATQMPERSQQSVSYSFHQQMARTINQQRQQMQQQNAAEESENSESSGGGGGGGSKLNVKNAANTNEIYVCVYCKHTFKSQYCYQKHAKRHLNPLSLSPGERSNCEKSPNNAGVFINAAAQFGGSVRPGALALPLVTNKQNATELLRREVRPLDMNVQYYPCKTCGSKFPSYYFVHKHRKLCHADEEATAAAAAATNVDKGNATRGNPAMNTGNAFATTADDTDIGDQHNDSNELNICNNSSNVGNDNSAIPENKSAHEN